MAPAGEEESDLGGSSSDSTHSSAKHSTTTSSTTTGATTTSARRPAAEGASAPQSRPLANRPPAEEKTAPIFAHTDKDGNIDYQRSMLAVDGTTLRVSRVLWEVIYTSDGCLRKDVPEQLTELIGVMAKLELESSQYSNPYIPVDLHAVHRSCLYAKRMWENCEQASDREKLWTRFQMYKHFEDAIQLLHVDLRPSAASWHNMRRAAILQQHPATAKLLKDEPLTPIMMAVIMAVHAALALALKHIEGGWQAALAIWLSAALVGGFCAFGFQALDHELCHMNSTPGTTLIGLLGGGFTTVPWFSYYFSGGHERHHKVAGTPRDIDRDAFFWAWERTPAALDSPLGSVLWASIIGAGLPVLYILSLGYCLLGNWRNNIRELGYFGANLISMTVVHATLTWYGGSRALWYLLLSMAFGNGFLCHPLMGFWIMQHLCHSVEHGDHQIGMQPTMSYSGSPLWNLLNFNALSHVEHHDFARCPWTRLHKLREMAPDFYKSVEDGGHMQYIPSVTGMIWEWVFTKGDKMNFACIRHKLPGWDADGSAPPGAPSAETKKTI
mmetsp:Transcript_44574/g.121463  ORF Transcript_44574/g.121463 Transcript_44574/m.121463 type:complete len:554 (-) Transcript_44574:391-2052(-)